MARGSFGGVVDCLYRLARGAGAVPTESDELLQKFVREGDEAAFAALVRRHGPQVWRVCRNLLSDVQDAEDAFQATFLVLVRKSASIAQPHLLGPWLHGVAYRVARRARAQAARRRRHELQAPIMPPPSPDSEIDWRELGPILEEEIHRLPEKYRLPIVLCHLQGKTNEQAAADMGCPKGTILSRLSRGRERLRARLTRRGITLTAPVFAAALSAAGASAAAPAHVVNATVAAGLAFAAGKTAGVSTAAAALAHKTVNAMFLAKLKTVALLLLALIGIAAGTVWAQVAMHSPSVGQSPPPRRAGNPNHQPQMAVIMNDSKKIQDWYANRFKEYHSQVYQASVDFPTTDIDPAVSHPMDTELSLSAKKIPRAEHGELPAQVRDAFQFYWDRFEKEDIGFVRAYEVKAGPKLTYAVRVKTDGDDGWLEIYDENGELLGAGRTYIELVWWGSRDHIRSLIGKDMPPEYDTKKTKWGTPLPW